MNINHNKAPYPQTILPLEPLEKEDNYTQTPPYPTMPYPGFVNYQQSNNYSNDSISFRLNNRERLQPVRNNSSNSIETANKFRNDSIQSASTFNSQFSNIKEENNIDNLSNYLNNLKVSGPDYVVQYNNLKQDALNNPDDVDIQISWIKQLFEITTNYQFVSTHNVNGELLQKELSSTEFKKNELTFIKQAVKLLKKLVIDTKHPELQFILGSLYSQSPTIKIIRPNILEKNYEKSLENYLKSASQSHPLALYRLGVSYELGIGAQQNPQKALECFNKAANLGNVQSMFKLGMIYSKGDLNTSVSAQNAIHWLLRASKLSSVENPYSLYELGKFHERDSTLSPELIHQLNAIKFPQDEELALNHYKEASRLKYPPAQCKLGFCYEYGKLGLLIDPKKSIGWYSRSAKNGYHVAEMALSGWYLTGAKGVLEPNDKEAFLWAVKSAESGFVKAEYALGYYYEVGLGCEKNLELSRKFYLRAATQGHEKAIQKLRRA